MPAPKHCCPTAGKWSVYDGAQIAVVFQVGGTRKAFRGTARYGHDPDIGNALIIPIDEAAHGLGTTELILSEREWEGEIRDGCADGCDYSFVPSDMWPPF